jgi:DNA replication licensing factor MCM2
MSQRRKRANSEADEDSAMSSPPPRTPADLPPSSPTYPFENNFEEQGEIRDDIIDDLEEAAEEVDGEDLFGDDMYRDYQRRDQDDNYDLGDEQIDDEEYDEMDPVARRRADEQLRMRDNLLRSQRPLPDAFMDDDDGPGSDLPTQRRRRHQYEDEIYDPEADAFNDALDEILSLEALGDVKAVSIPEWIAQPVVHRSIAKEFRNFLVEYTDDNGVSVYGTRILALGEKNLETLEVTYSHLVESKAILAHFLVTAPSDILKIFDLVAMEVIELHYPTYSSIHSEVHVRITDLPRSFTLRELRENHLNTLIRVSGVVTRRTGVFPQLKYVKFDCLKCGITIGPIVQESNTETKVSYCHNCQSRGPFQLNSEKTLYRNYQRVTLQESPGTVPPGRLPRHREVILLWDLIDIAKPGEEIDITGIYKNAYDGGLNAKNGFPVFSTVIEANMVQRRDSGQAGEFNLSHEEEKQIRDLANQRHIIDRIISSIAPSIYGHKAIKTAIACSLFGGEPKNIKNKHRIRGDINVLLLGDPGTAKSQLLKYAEKTSHRAVFATGQGASAVGLTASVRKDPITREWTLEGGALVLADKGTCLIDEFDKMNDQDRTSIHEAMEQQSISISKAGIVTSLQARCAIIAAANPNGGRYNSTIPLSQNVDLTEPILSRFDLLCVVRDIVDPEKDGRLAEYVVQSHLNSHPDKNAVLEDDDDDVMDEDEDTQQTTGDDEHLPGFDETQENAIPQDLLRKYIYYARTRVHPTSYKIDQDKIAKVYSDLRRESLATGSFPITVRHLESIMRISESFARMRLREEVTNADVDRAIKATVASFVGAQKMSVRKSLEQSFRKYTI